MGQDLAASFMTAQTVFQQADDILGFRLSHIAWTGPEDELNDTINTQPALLVHSVAALFVFQEMFPAYTPALTAGHSMGELSALVASGTLPFADALLLARERGRLMKRAGTVTPGGMAAILGLDIPVLENICAEASTSEKIVQVANDNCPGQIVISGESAALDRAMALAQQAGARRVLRLAVSIAAHSPLMVNAQQDFNQAVIAAPMSEPRVPLVGNVTASPLSTVAEIRADLQGQLTNRVRWTETIQYMASHGISNFIEFGSGTVLGGLIKRISRDANCFSAGTPADFEKLRMLPEV